MFECLKYIKLRDVNHRSNYGFDKVETGQLKSNRRLRETGHQKPLTKRVTSLFCEILPNRTSKGGMWNLVGERVTRGSHLLLNFWFEIHLLMNQNDPTNDKILYT